MQKLLVVQHKFIIYINNENYVDNYITHYENIDGEIIEPNTYDRDKE